MRIISGGQTGVDLAGLDAAVDISRTIPLKYGGFAPKGMTNEDGIISPHYGLVEIKGGYKRRTLMNLGLADVVLVYTRTGLNTPGTNMTINEAIKRQILVVVLENSWRLPVDQLLGKQTIMVAGPRESKAPGIYEESKPKFNQLFRVLLEHDTSQPFGGY